MSGQYHEFRLLFAAISLPCARPQLATLNEGDPVLVAFAAHPNRSSTHRTRWMGGLGIALARRLATVAAIAALAAAELTGAGASAAPAVAAAAGPGPVSGSDAAGWGSYVPAEAMRARSHVQQFPQLDGRGLVVAVLDTGVDPLAQGLQRTSDGRPKVIEAVDFSGQGDVVLQPAVLSGAGPDAVALLGNGRTAAVGKLVPPADGQWWTGVFREQAIGPTKLRDLNQDGRSDGELTVLAWRTGTGPYDARLLVDWDGDGDVAEEAAVRPYRVAQELLIAPPQRDAKLPTQLSFAFEPAWATSTAQLHFTDGSHGTHVAGIIAGYQMFGRQGWDGVAPGAQVLSLKIGHNARSGGATPTGAFAKALRYAGEWSRNRGVPVVVNASYGIPAGTEGKGDLDLEVNRLVQEFPLLTIAFSAGNEGPGLSSVGSPAGAALAIAVGAALPKDAVPALYGGQIDQTELFSFSSRGGELAKPEVVAPGAASAAVPVWDGHEIKQGTSMASPQAAGAMLLVWAALLQAPAAGTKEALDRGLHSGIIRRALQFSARSLPGYSPLDQGHGMIDVPNAIALAKRLSKRADARVLGWHQASHAPRADGETMPATYLRAGWQSDGPAVFAVDVKAYLPSTWSADQRGQFAQVLDIHSKTDWIEVQRPRLQVRGERESPFEVRILPNKLKTPGVHVGWLTARDPGAPEDEVSFVHQVTVVVPWQVTAAEGFAHRFEGIKLKAGKVWRLPVAVPSGAQLATVSLKRREGHHCQVALALYDPEGSRQRPAKRWASSKDATDAEWMVQGEDLTSGVWEVTASAWIAPGEESLFDVEVRFGTVSVKGSGELAAESGGAPIAKVLLTQHGSTLLQGTARGQIDLWQRTQELKVETDKLSHPITLGPAVSAAEVVLTLDRRLYDSCTDVAVAVRDAQGEIVAESAFGAPTAELRWSRKGTEGRYTLEVTAGFAKPRKEPWKIQVKERLLLVKPLALQVKGPGQGGTRLQLYPYQTSRWAISASEPLPLPPKGFRALGRVDLLADDGRTLLLTLPVRSAE